MDGVAMEKSTLDLENGLASGISENPLVFTSSFKYNSANRLIESTNFMGTQSIEWNDDKLTATNSNSIIGPINYSYTYDKNYTTKGYNPLIPYTISSTEMLFVAHPELAGLATQKLFNSESSSSIINDMEYKRNNIENYSNQFVKKHPLVEYYMELKHKERQLTKCASMPLMMNMKDKPDKEKFKKLFEENKKMNIYLNEITNNLLGTNTTSTNN
jgi:hypothetical protein